jgi:hypothetical protein
MEARRYAAIAVGTVLLALNSAARAGDAADGTIVAVDRAACDDMKRHNVLPAGMPVGCERLRLVKFSYLGFDGRTHGDGEIMVMDAAAENVRRIFGKLRAIGFPIAKAILINRYDGSDDASLADNNTAAFNGRNVAGTGTLSLHAYGLAIDLDPVQNPYVQREGSRVTFSPPAGVAYANRANARPGMAEAILDVFADEGFVIWGGRWRNPDYQHFQVSRGFAQRLARLSPAQARAAFAQHVARYRTCRRSGGTWSRCVVLEANTGHASPPYLSSSVIVPTR